MFFSIFLLSLFIIFDLSITEHSIASGYVDALDIPNIRRLRSASVEELIPEQAVNVSDSTSTTTTPSITETSPAISTVGVQHDLTVTSTRKPKARHTKKHRTKTNSTLADETPNQSHEFELPSSFSVRTSTIAEITTSPPPRAHDQQQPETTTASETSGLTTKIAQMLDATISTVLTPAFDTATTSVEPLREEHIAIAGHKFGRLHHKHKSTTAAPTDTEQLTLEGGDEDALAQASNSSSSSSDKSTTKPKTDDGDAPAVKSTETEIEISEPQEPRKRWRLIYKSLNNDCLLKCLTTVKMSDVKFCYNPLQIRLFLLSSSFSTDNPTFYGKIPILEVDGKPLAQCYAISRYLAKQFGLIGADDWEAAKLDEVADFHKGVHTELSPYIFVISGYRRGDRDALRKDVFIPIVEKNFPIYVNLLKQSTSGFFGRNNVTWIDFLVSEYMSTIKHYEPVIMEKYPLITKFIEKVQSLPQIKDYIKSRAQTPLQVQY